MTDVKLNLADIKTKYAAGMLGSHSVIPALVARVEELEAECFSLAAITCDCPIATEGGSKGCEYERDLHLAKTEITRLQLANDKLRAESINPSWQIRMTEELQEARNGWWSSRERGEKWMEETQFCEEKITRLRKALDDLARAFAPELKRQQEEIKRLMNLPRKENKRLREALSVYEDGPYPECEIARAALEAQDG